MRSLETGSQSGIRWTPQPTPRFPADPGSAGHAAERLSPAVISWPQIYGRSMPQHPSSPHKFRVVIAGGGVAALEGLLALHELAADHVEVTLLTSSQELVMRPMAVREPFAYPGPNRYPVAAIAAEHGARVVSEDLVSVDGPHQTVCTTEGTIVPYDALLVACGARPSVRYEHAVTIDDRKLDELLHGMIQDIEGDYIHSLAFITPPRMAWPLPLYELALLTAERAWAMGIELQTTLITPEDRPLAMFGSTVSAGVQELLSKGGVNVITSGQVEVPARREVVVYPGARKLHVDRVIALPELFGPAVPGLPSDEFGFLPIDDHCLVSRAAHVYAAGDAANFPIKHGGLGTQMADTAARSIAALAGAPVSPTPLDPILRGMLLTGRAPRYLYAHRVGGHAFNSEFSETPTWDPPTKISSHYLAPYLEARDATAAASR